MNTINRIKIPSFKTALAVMPITNTLYVCWYVWQVIKLWGMKFADSFSKESNDKTEAHQVKLDKGQDLFAASLGGAALLWFIFGQESILNTMTYVIGLYLYHTAKVLINMQTAFQSISFI
jgi:hypothetical protein